MFVRRGNCLLPSNSIAYIEFKTEAEAEKMLEQAQGTDVQGRSIIIDFVGEKSQKGGKMSGKFLKVFCETRGLQLSTQLCHVSKGRHWNLVSLSNYL